jgi:serine/threonine protein kinase
MNGQILSNRYKIINILGAGGMGQTYIAEDTQSPDNLKCVVKQLKPISNDSNFLVTASRLFAAEAETLEKLGQHDQIPQLFDRFEENGEFYLVQEFIDGQPLSAEMPLGERCSESQVIALLTDILGILEFIHGQGVIHRDIKPDNIIRRKQDGKLVLIDFGAVKQVRLQQTTAVEQISQTVGIGTLGYMPTEQSSGKPRTSSDLYALGKVAIQSLTGLLPSQLREDEDGEAVWRDQAEVSDGLANILTTMTRHYFKHRYQSASEVLQALKDLEFSNVSRNYTPTQSVSNSGYTPTEVTPSRNSSTQVDHGRAGQSKTRQPKPQSPKIRQNPKVNPHTTVQQSKPTPSSSSNRLLFIGAIFSSVLIAGVLIYSNMIRNPIPDTTEDPIPDTTEDPIPDTTEDPIPDTTEDPIPDTTEDPFTKGDPNPVDPGEDNVEPSIGEDNVEKNDRDPRCEGGQIDEDEWIRLGCG